MRRSSMLPCGAGGQQYHFVSRGTSLDPEQDWVQIVDNAFENSECVDLFRGAIGNGTTVDVASCNSGDNGSQS
jgi:hypothetical protein